jgi:hypothetical protein
MPRNSIVAALALLFALSTVRSTSAHRLDEYLQAARIGLETDGVSIELDLTPGVAVAGSVLTSIDRDADGSLSGDEQAAYARAVIRALEIDVDDVRLPVELIAFEFPETSAFHRGEGTIRLRARVSHPVLSAGAHVLFYRNTHFENRAVYLANALVPQSPRVAVTEQRRDRKQSELTITYAVQSRSARFAVAMPAFGLAGVLLLVCCTVAFQTNWRDSLHTH